MVSVGEGQYSEKHSRFLGFAMPCRSEKQATEIIAEKRREYWDARHAVYAYILPDGSARFSDDGEPHGTAGKPVLDILKAGNLTGVIVIVVRYFGGILLGTGGLVRAYTAAASEAVKNAEKARITAGESFSLNIGYADYDKLTFILKEAGAEIKSTDFADTVRVLFAVKSDAADACLKSISEAFSSSVLPKFEEKTVIHEKF